MENTPFFDDEPGEEARKNNLRYLAAVSVKLLWTSLTVAALLGLLLPLTVFLGWSNYALSCLLGLLTGISLTAGIFTSLQNRSMITLLLGVLILPGLAVYASLRAGYGPQALEAASSVLMPFLSYALATLIGGIITVKIWRNMPSREQTREEERAPDAVVTPSKKEHTSHEGSDLDKAA
jgi:hypothetical protein